MIKIHFCISGFTQTNGRSSGVLKLAEKLHEAGYSSGALSRVFLHPWKADWSTIAEHAWLLSQLHEQPLAIGIYAYSWGAGYGAIALAKQLRERGISVRSMVLSDPVPRPCLPLRWTAMLPAAWGRSIRIPPNVTEVTHLYQRINLPQGHRIAPGSKSTIVNESAIDVAHQYADDHPEFHRLSMIAAATVSAET